MNLLRGLAEGLKLLVLLAAIVLVFLTMPEYGGTMP